MSSSTSPQHQPTTFLTLPRELRQEILIGTVVSLLESLAAERRKRNQRETIRCLNKRFKKTKAHAEILRGVHTDIVDDVNYVEKLCMDRLRVRIIEWNVEVFGVAGNLLEGWETEWKNKGTGGNYEVDVPFDFECFL